MLPQPEENTQKRMEMIIEFLKKKGVATSTEIYRHLAREGGYRIVPSTSTLRKLRKQGIVETWREKGIYYNRLKNGGEVNE